MKVCVPTMEDGGLNGMVAQHFGRAPTFTIVEIETNAVEVIPNTGEHMGGAGVPPDFIALKGTHIMLCSGLGPRAVNMFEQYGIDVFVGASGTVLDAITAWQNELLSEATDGNTCREHRHC